MVIKVPDNKKVTRKLRAILSADVKGYSLLMADDEIHTIQTLKAYRSLMSDLIQQYSGRVVDNPGDNLLAEFSSAVDAVDSAVEIQKRLTKKNAKFVEDKQLQFRIGINIGDVVQDDDRIYGEAVNIAARIENLSDAGGICISRSTYDQIKNKLQLDTEYLGEHEVKNIKDPVRVYRVLLDADSPKPLVEEQLELPDIPSIAVLPFINMSADKDQEYFCDGIAEDILNDLTSIEGLHVVARTSSFAFKGENRDIREIGMKLEAHTIVEGSVRKAGNRLRITTQIVNVADGYHLWSERYDRELEDVFAIQEEIAKNIVRALKIKLSTREKSVLGKVKTQDVQAYDFYLRGREFFHQERRKNIHYAAEMFTRAIKKDPDYALAYAGLADCYSFLFIYFEKKQENIEQSVAASKKAIELDPELAEAHAAHGLAVSLSMQYDEAEKEFDKAIKLNPKLYEAYYFYARTCRQRGKIEKAVLLFKKAGEVRPEDYQAAVFLATAYKDLNLHAEAENAAHRAIELVEKHLRFNPDDARALYLGGLIHMALGEVEKAINWAERAHVIDPDDPGVLYNLTCIYSLAGKIELALDCFEIAIQSGFASREWIENDLDLDPIRNQPRFQKALKELN
jgi:adenylate cyclase